jgi:saccharopine dehydrogenase-like NADP-dependent oxidoreductase
MKLILILGAGKSSIYLIDYLVSEAVINKWKVIVADSNLQSARNKIKEGPHAAAIELDVLDLDRRRVVIAQADIVISLLPPALHYFIATDCLELSKHLFTASYIDENLRALEREIAEKNLLFLCELGLDPGIDHMSAIQMIDEISNAGGKIISFKSHCGGLVAPESDDNPWHYKISWNPRNVVLAGQAGAVFKENGEICHLPYSALFRPENTVDIPGLGELCWYANRNSLPYIDLYGLVNCHTFLRTTLRYPEFCLGWKSLVDLKFTDQTIMYNTDGMTLQSFFKAHLNNNGFAEWVDINLTTGFRETTDVIGKLERLIQLKEDPEEDVHSDLKKFMLIDEKGALTSVGIDEIKATAAHNLAWQKHEASLIISQLLHLGMNDNITVINKGSCSAADVLQFILETKLPLHSCDRDMVVMLHELIYTINGTTYEAKSSLVVKGVDHVRTAMAKTVGLPLAIAATLFLQGKLPVTGLQIPVLPTIYGPVLKRLSENGISFTESHMAIS